MQATTKSNDVSRWIVRGVLALLALGLCAAVIIFAATRKPPPVKAAPIQARLELGAGEVTVDHGSGEARAASGMALLEGAKVKTAKGARALVRLPDGSTIFLRDESAVKLGASTVTLEQGEYWLDAPPTDREPMIHSAGDTTVSAADSGLSVKLVDGSGVVYVARGMAIVTAKSGRVEVNAGEQATIAGAEAPRVAPLAFWEDWTGGMADFKSAAGTLGSGMGTIHGVDVGAPHGAKAKPLEISRQSVRAVVREGLAETEVDQTFFNPSERPVEGWYWFTVPRGASITSFSVETNGQLVEGEFIEKKEAARKYGAAKATGHAPAILEWVDARTYRARIFPVPASGTRRVVLRYIELKPIVEGKLVYVYPMGSGDAVRIGEFSLSVDLGDAGKKMEIATLADARVEAKGKRVTMRRSGYTPRADFQLEAKLPSERDPLTISRFSAGGDSADYVMARYTPDVDWKKVQQIRGDVVVVVDTSAAGDEASRQLKVSTAEAILRALSDDDRFALVSLDVRPKVLHPEKELAAASDQEISKALEKLSEHSTGGATDLASLFDVALKRLHGTEQPAVVYVGDGIATSGEMTGEQLVERLRRALSTSRARLFTVGIGPEADHALLGELARSGGGSSLRVDEPGEATARALQLASALKVPTITDFQIDMGAGLDEVFVSASGKVSQGSDVVMLARTHHDIPAKVTIKGRLSGEPFEKEYKVRRDKSVVTAFVPRLWAAEYVRRLLGGAAGPDAERGRVAALGIEYGLMTPFTSILALESEWAYSNMGIQRRRSPLRGVRLSALGPDEERRLAGALAAGPAPAVMFGCGKLARSKDEATASPAAKPPTGAAAPAEQNQSGLGQRTATAELEEKEAQPVTAAPMPAKRAKSAPAQPKGQALADEGESDDEALPSDQPAPEPAAEEPALAGKLDKASGASGGRFGPGGGSAATKKPASARSPRPRDAPGRGDLKGKGGKDGWERGKKNLGVRGPSARTARWASVQLGTCSDSAARPLAQRVLLWRKRLRTAGDAAGLMDRFAAARRACELPDWRAERTFLELMQKHVKSEAGVSLMLAQFSGRPEVQKFLAKLILRRSVDSRMVAAVERALFGSAVDWNKVDLELSAIEDADQRIAKLREFMARAPEDPNGDIRLVQLLAQADRKDEAVARGRRLRDRGFLTPHIAQRLGDVLARAKLDAEAVRTYSEIVEFDAKNVASRRLLGDIYLGHGWYAPAYRQYRTITELAPNDALGVLRLAAAAAGAGRIDEALRLQRRVASAQGNPGPRDPRTWARLWSAARLARLVDKPPPPTPGQPKVDPARRVENIKRKLKELQLFSGPAALVLLTWEDLSTDLALVARVDDKDTEVGESTDAAVTGLYASLMARADYDRVGFEARLRSLPRASNVALIRHDVLWDGKDFQVTIKPAVLSAKETQATL